MRIVKMIFGFYFLLCTLSSKAQDNLMPPYLIQSDTALNQFISSGYWEKLEDNAGRYSIADVMGSALSGKFRSAGKYSTVRDSLSKTHWIRFKIRNGMTAKAGVAIGSGADFSDFYLVKSGDSIRHFTSGSKFSWRKKDGLKKINAIPIELQPTEEMLVYLRRQNESSFHISSDYRIPIYSTDKYIQSEFNDYQQNALEIPYIYLSFFSGMILLAAIFNFLIYRAVKNKVNLYFSLFLLGIFMWYSPIFRVLIPRESWLLGEYLYTLGDVSVVFLLFFIRHYFQLFTSRPKWDRFLVIFSIIVISLSVVSRLFQIKTATVSTFIGAVVSVYLIVILVTFILCAFQKGEPKKIFYKAVLPLIIFLSIGILLSLVFSQLANSQEWLNITDYIGGICIMWAVIIFSKYLFEDYGKQQQKILQVQIEKEREQAEFIALQKVELEQQVIERTEELNNSIIDLKSTQSQLIQAEKMASLGELTAGIAHEIQNPLNFVNNFSEVNKELLEEMKEEIDKGNFDAAKNIANDIIDNEEKIISHGKRADVIVKGMLQHSRSSSGQREPTDINALTDEYLRLAYHGLRAKDKTFNAILETDFDNRISALHVNAQDIGRVILNLITNAFYAVNERRRTELPLTSEELTGGSSIERYEPRVTITTRRLSPPSGGWGAELTVKDNGSGIPQHLLDKIFQPFFTTKPTGQGTGLGLSLAYDIIKAHAGELKVETKEGDGTTFTIQLPVSNA